MIVYLFSCRCRCGCGGIIVTIDAIVFGRKIGCGEHHLLTSTRSRDDRQWGLIDRGGGTLGWGGTLDGPLLPLLLESLVVIAWRRSFTGEDFPECNEGMAGKVTQEDTL